MEEIMGMVNAMMKNSFCLKSDTVTITPSNFSGLFF